MRRIVVAISTLSLAVFILSSCTDQAQSSQRTSISSGFFRVRTSLAIHCPKKSEILLYFHHSFVILFAEAQYVYLLH